MTAREAALAVGGAPARKALAEAGNVLGLGVASVVVKVGKLVFRVKGIA